MMPSSLLITVYKEKTKEEMRKLASTVKMAFLDTEIMKWEWVVCGRRQEGSTSGMAGDVCMDKGTCKSRTAGWPGSTRSAKV